MKHESCEQPEASGAVVDAGPFGEWLVAMRAVLRGERDADVPCGDCVGCCVSAYPIPLRPTDRVALARVPAQFLEAAPGQPPGHALMGFREDGTCPMFVGHRCSIYADRPQTCRDYDCRIYAATGLLPDGDRPAIQQRVQAWRFEYADGSERQRAEALLRAAAFIRKHGAQFPGPMRAQSATAAAVLAVKTWPVFQSGRNGQTDSAEATIAAVIDAARLFDAGRS